MKMSAGQRYPTIPENADKILFAEDLVNHILCKLSLPSLSSGIADHRDLVYNAFGPQERLAANYRFNSVEETIEKYFDRLIKKTAVDSNVFVKYIEFFKPFIHEFTRPESHAHVFLDTSVRFSLLAGQFYMCGILDAPTLAVDHIVSIIKKFDMVNDGGWKAVHILSARWAQFYVQLEKSYLSPEYDYDFDADNKYSDSEMDGRQDSDEDLEECGDDAYSEEFLDSCSSATNEPVPSSSVSERIKKTADGKFGNILTFLDSILESLSTRSPGRKTFMVTFHSSNYTLKEDSGSVENIRIEQIQKQYCSCSKETGNLKKYDTYVQTADDIVPFGRPLTEKHFDIVGSQLNKHHKSDSDDGKIEKNSEASIYSIENISREYDIFMQNIRSKTGKQYCSYSKKSGSCLKKYDTYVQTADDIVPFGRPLTKKHFDIVGSQLNKHHKSDSDDGKVEKNSEASIYSIENISREYDIFMQNIRRNQTEKPSCSYWKESDSNSKKYIKDVQTADDINSLCQQLTEERSAIFSLSANELPKKDSAQHLKLSSSDNQNDVEFKFLLKNLVEEKKLFPKKGMYLLLNTEILPYS